MSEKEAISCYNQKKLAESEKWRKWILAHSRMLSKLGKKAW